MTYNINTFYETTLRGEAGPPRAPWDPVRYNTIYESVRAPVAAASILREREAAVFLACTLCVHFGQELETSAGPVLGVNSDPIARFAHETTPKIWRPLSVTWWTLEGFEVVIVTQIIDIYFYI